MTATYEYDVFISYASEDKENFVRPLAEELETKGYRVWYDEMSLSWGDNLSSSIDKGISQSKFGIIVLSQNFFNKKWTERELNGFVSKVVNDEKVILPIWHQVSRKEVLAFSPTLADKLAIDSSRGIDYIVSKLHDILTHEPATPKIVINRTQKTAQYYKEDLGSEVKLEMMLIPAGTFIMGAPETEEGSSDEERPQHEVTLPTFFMGRYPVTQAQWKAVAALPKINRELERDPSEFKGDNRPVESISWYDAVEFCDRLAAHTKRQYRLPSEAEWEYACRAGTTTPFHFGETITTDLANYRGTDNEQYKWSGSYGRGSKGIYREETTVVGSFGVANAFGLCDMHGNVWEWCLDDWHDNYEGAPTDGSPWFDNKNDNLFQRQGRVVLRGGSWSYSPIFCRSASRYDDGRAVRVIPYFFGFRVVCAFGRDS